MLAVSKQVSRDVIHITMNTTEGNKRDAVPLGPWLGWLDGSLLPKKCQEFPLAKLELWKIFLGLCIGIRGAIN